MGNCFTREQASAAKSCGFPTEAETSQSTSSSPTSLLKTSEGCMPRGVKQDNNVIRLSIVVTTQELSSILKCNKDGQKRSIEQLLDMVNLRGRKITRIENGGEEKTGKAWKPLLATIPEAEVRQ